MSLDKNAPKLTARAEAHALQDAWDAALVSLSHSVKARLDADVTDGMAARMSDALEILCARHFTVLPKVTAEGLRDGRRAERLGAKRTAAKRTATRRDRVEVAVGRKANARSLGFAIAAALFEALPPSTIGEKRSPRSGSYGTGARRAAFAWAAAGAGEATLRTPKALSAEGFAATPIAPASPIDSMLDAIAAALPEGVVPGATAESKESKSVAAAVYTAGEAGWTAPLKLAGLTRKMLGAADLTTRSGLAVTVAVLDHAGNRLASLEGVVLVKKGGKWIPHSAATMVALDEGKPVPPFSADGGDKAERDSRDAEAATVTLEEVAPGLAQAAA